MLEESILDKNQIKKIVNNNFNIKVKNVKKINRGSANIYNLDDRYILKEFSSDRKIEDIEKEYRVISHLADKNLKVPKYIETKDNKCYFIYNGRIIIMQLFLEGYTLENNTGDYYKTIESARMLGMLSKALEDYKLDDNYEEWIEKKDLDDSVEKLLKLKDSINKDNPYHDRFISDINKKIEICKNIDLNFEEMKKVSLKVCHGDYSVQQLIFNDKLGTAIIDFETIKTMPIVWEIIRSYSYIDENVKDGRFNMNNFIDYVKEVTRYIKLTKYDLKYMPYIYILQLAGSTFGYKQYNNDYNKKGLLEFALFRTNLCSYLYDDLEKISNELMKLS